MRQNVANRIGDSITGKLFNSYSNTKYDSNLIVASKTAYSSFVVPIGGQNDAGTTKTLADTNMTESGSLPKNNGFNIYQIGFRVYAPSTASTAPITWINDFRAFWAQCSVQFNFNGLEYLGQWNGSEWMNVENFAGSVGTAPITASFGTFVMPYKKLRKPIKLRGQDKFNMTFTVYNSALVTTPLVGTRIVTHLEGIEGKLL